MKLYLLAGFLFISISLSSQSKQDYQWIFASNSLEEEGVESTLFDFNQSELDIIPQKINHRISSNNASICDENGNLLFYTNGCLVSNSDNEMIENGIWLNDGYILNVVNGGNCNNGYNGVQNIMILPDPAYSNGFYILHKTKEYDQEINELYIPGLKYSYVDMAQNEGKGKVTEKNVFYTEGLNFLSSYFTVIKHANQEDWWILQPVRHSNIYQKCLLSDEGISPVDTQHIGNDFYWNASASGQAKFSPNGEHYAIFNPGDKLQLFDFDRETGQLSNFNFIDVPTDNSIGGLEFSPNSRFVYMSTLDSLWQVDIESQNLQESLTLIDTWDKTYDPFQTTFHLMQMGPDCRIYMCSTSSTYSYHVINNPNEKGVACDFVQHGVRLPYTSSVANLPNFPHFRIDEEEICDPTITSVFGIPIASSFEITTYPNPSSNYVQFNFPDNVSFPLNIEVLNIAGQKIYQGTISSSTQQVSIQSLPKGIHVYFLTDQEKLRYTGKMVIE